MAAVKTLVIEPDAALQRKLKSSLHNVHIQVVALAGLRAIMDKVKQVRPELIIFDASTPKIDGSAVLAELQKTADTQGIPVILVDLKTPSEWKAGEVVARILQAVSQAPSADPEITSALEDLGLSQEMLARILQVSARTVARWLAGDVEPSPDHRERLEKIKQIHREMLKALRPGAISKYLQAYNETLGGRRPLDLLLSHQFDAILADLAALQEGVHV